MSETLTIALDAMGGDRAPDVVIKGANVARVRHPDARFLLFGDETQLVALLQRYPKLAAVSTVRHSDTVVGASDKPSNALRQGRDSSMRHAIDAVRDGEAVGVVSAGNTGALMAMAMTVLKTLPGIRRPAMASILPTQRGQTVMLDLGANVECTAENLVQFAVMGEVFARAVLGVVTPTVGLLNVGIEMVKGNDTVRTAAKLLQAGNLPITFYGFVEGDDITAGTVDVVVTDGFTGNVALKTAEGTARLCSQFLRTAFKQSLWSRIGYVFARRAILSLREQLDPRSHNGGTFLGLNGVVVKSHGSTDVLGFANAIDFAVDIAKEGFNDKVIAELAQWYAVQGEGAAAAAAV
ncbi:MAG: phosphate acyltransferase PlsX [Proteobacteria bacterium]|nr:phosphate acyltransferase PlsX [Pseudomonadota bacterium]MCH9020150.1 phosphate acyltransferase PlsX [Pseudomonadota bacterium]